MWLFPIWHSTGENSDELERKRAPAPLGMPETSFIHMWSLLPSRCRFLELHGLDALWVGQTPGYLSMSKKNAESEMAIGDAARGLLVLNEFDDSRCCAYGSWKRAISAFRNRKRNIVNRRTR